MKALRSLSPPLSQRTVEDVFKARGWRVFQHQKEAWLAYANQHDLLIISPTGSGKTLTALGGPLNQAQVSQQPLHKTEILYVCPMRALSRDLYLSTRAFCEELGFEGEIALRNGDSSSYERQKQKKKPPRFLFTTPESLALLLTQPECFDQFSELKAIIIDEWHELASSKRGGQLCLNLERLRRISQSVRVIGVSATLCDHQRSMEMILRHRPRLIQSDIAKEIEIKSLLPNRIDQVPWAGHLGLKLLPHFLEHLDPACSQLVFTNTRAQAELWYEALLNAKPEWREILALHHGSLDRQDREAIEAGIKDGRLKICICTSTLDLGVDLPKVDRVFQIGSIKALSRLIQRAGRSGHRLGERSRLYFLPTHAFQILECDAARWALQQKRLENKTPPEAPLDVLAQHLVNLSMAEDLDGDEIFKEIKSCYHYRDLSKDLFQKLLCVLEKGSEVLEQYPEYQKLVRDQKGRYRLANKKLQLLQRANIGCITSDSSVAVCYRKGKTIGYVEEAFVSRLKSGDVFLFSGKRLRFERLYQMKAYVSPAKAKTGNRVAVWSGGQLPISDQLGRSLRERFDGCEHLESRELQFCEDLLKAQKQWSAIPQSNELLIESFQSREGRHLCLFPFEGLMVNEALGALVASYLASKKTMSFSICANDYGVELLTDRNEDLIALFDQGVFSCENLESRILNAVNLAELKKRKFRSIAQIAGLIFQNYPGKFKGARQLQASSSLIYDVLEEYDAEHLYLKQALHECLNDEFELERISACLQRLQNAKLIFKELDRASPFSYPLIVERVGVQLSTESLEQRVEKMKEIWKKGPRL